MPSGEARPNLAAAEGATRRAALIAEQEAAAATEAKAKAEPIASGLGAKPIVVPTQKLRKYQNFPGTRPFLVIGSKIKTISNP
jgi:hypothetical protein